MKLKFKSQQKLVHTHIVPLVNWSSNNQIYSISDDKTILTWNSIGEYQGKFVDLDYYCTSSDWSDSKGGNSYSNKSSSNDVLALGTSEGNIKLISRSGKLEKSVNNAHSQAVTCIQWSSDNNTILSASEDGNIKTWSKNLELRNHLIKDLRSSIYCAKWNNDATVVIFCSGNYIYIEPILKGNSKSIKFKAHEELVLCIDWNKNNKTIISGGEDRKYKIWDQYGRNLYTSNSFNSVITSLSWAPSGEYFAVGSFENIKLCNKSGWSYSFTKVDTGGVMSLSWSNDGNAIAVGGGNGRIVVGSLVERSVTWKNLEIKLDEDNKLIINDFEKNQNSEIDFKDNIVDMKAGYNYLIIVTSSQCHIYPINNLNTPFKFDIKDRIKSIFTCPMHFALLDNNNSLHIYQYEGKQIATPNLQGIRISSIPLKSISISNDILAILNPNNWKNIKLYDLSSGKLLSNSIDHSMDINEIALNQSVGNRERKLCFIDVNKDLYITNCYQTKLLKICSMCDTFKWNESNDMIAAIADDKYYCWIYPNAIYLDKELLDGSKYEKDASEIGKNCQIVSFTGSFCNVLKSDGSICTKSITPYASILLNLLNFNDGLERGLKLCRYVKDKVLWTAYSAICINYSEINIAETAFAAIDEVDKVRFIDKIIKMKDQCDSALVHAYILLLSNKVDEAENILLQSKLIYRAIKLNINLFRWDRAYNLAYQNKVHIDTVLGFRNKYLEASDLVETSSKFIELAKDVKVDWNKIRAKIEEDKEAEKKK